MSAVLRRYSSSVLSFNSLNLVEASPSAVETEKSR
jgi:hypothetical protein